VSGSANQPSGCTICTGRTNPLGICATCEQADREFLAALAELDASLATATRCDPNDDDTWNPTNHHPNDPWCGLCGHGEEHLAIECGACGHPGLCGHAQPPTPWAQSSP
jgi:hypothetical protein